MSEHAYTESEALRKLNWPASRRGELRNLLPSIEVATGRIYERSKVDEIASDMTQISKLRERGNTQLFTR
jgi:hypothetical protein